MNKVNREENSNWDSSYEWKAMAVLGFGFCLVGLYPRVVMQLIVMEDDGLSAGDVGPLGIVALIWGVFAIIAGRLSDKIGHRKVLIPAVVLFSMLVGLVGMVKTLVPLTVVLVLMAAMKGSYYATGLAAVAAASRPARRGCNLGLLQSCSMLPVLALPFMSMVVFELRLSMSLSSMLWIVAVPGFVVGALLLSVLREPKETQAGESVGAHGAGGSWIELLRSRNTIVCIVAVACAFVPITVLPIHLILNSELLYSIKVTDAGVVLLASAFGGFFGQFGWSALSDVIGRKTVAVLGFVGATIAAWWFIGSDASTPELFVALFVCSYFCFGNSALVTGPIATESAPVGLVASAIGVVVGAGVLFSGVAPTIAYGMAGAYGYQTVGWVALAGAALGIFVCAFLKETAPLKAVKNLGTVGGTSGEPHVKDRKSMVVAYVLWILLGGFGVYRFYLGRVASGVVLLHLTLLFLFFLVLRFVAIFIPGGGPLFEDIYVLLGLTITVWLVVDAFRIPNLVRSGQHDM